MSYNIEEIFDWDDGIPYDEFGQALRPDELYDINKEPTKNKNQAIYAREATDPYGTLRFVVGNEDDYVCFDYAKLPSNMIVLHSATNSETMGYMDDSEYFILTENTAVDAALGMVETALDWLTKNHVEHDSGHWGQGPYNFYHEISRVCGG